MGSSIVGVKSPLVTAQSAYSSRKISRSCRSFACSRIRPPAPFIFEARPRASGASISTINSRSKTCSNRGVSRVRILRLSPLRHSALAHLVSSPLIRAFCSVNLQHRQDLQTGSLYPPLPRPLHAVRLAPDSIGMVQLPSLAAVGKYLGSTHDILVALWCLAF